MGALRSALAAKFADGKLVVVENFQIAEAKSKKFRQTLDALKVDGTALVVDSGDNYNLLLSARNLAGVELVDGKEVHPYHLLRYDRAVFAREALDRLQDGLKGSASRRNREVA
jgi:large subunit ribosomal protein L4